MSNTPKNINVPPREFVDLYDKSGIPIGSPITVTQITDTPAKVTFGPLPTGEYGHKPLMSVGSSVDGKSDEGAFIWSEFGCVINVSDFFSDAGDVEFAGAPSTILVTNNGTTATPVTSDPNQFEAAEITSPLTAPVTGYDADFISGSNQFAVAKHNSTETRSYRVDFSGTIIANDPSFLDTYIGIKVASSLGQEFTGGIKFYPVGVSFGGSSPAIGFSTVVFGSIAPGEELGIELSSNTAGDLILTDLIMFAVRISPAGG